MAVRTMSLLLGAAATALVLSTGSMAFVGQPSAKVPLESDASLRGSAAVRMMALDAAAVEGAAPEAEEVSMGHVARAALAMMAAFVVAVLPVADAHAARGGGRIGGSAPPARKAPPPPSKTAPQAQKEKVTVIERNTTIIAPAAPAVVYAPPTLGEMVAGAAVQGVVSGVVSGAVQSSMMPRAGPSSTDKMLEGQMRQDERQLDKQAMELEMIKMQLAEVQAQKK